MTSTGKVAGLNFREISLIQFFPVHRARSRQSETGSCQPPLKEGLADPYQPDRNLSSAAAIAGSPVLPPCHLPRIMEQTLEPSSSHRPRRQELPHGTRHVRFAAAPSHSKPAANCI